MSLEDPIPISLYIHIPWCVKKCPYCDFNSHNIQSNTAPPFEAYTKRLIADFEYSLPYLKGRPLHSIFIGGGTPSLMPGPLVILLLNEIRARTAWKENIEITLEANPGTVDAENFFAYKEAGINRLSIGAQSFNPQALQRIGRIHDPQAIYRTIETLQKVGFPEWNLDIMYGLPNQTPQEAQFDLQAALAVNPTHISWYQFTLEPNTFFYQNPPILPDHDTLFDIQDEGLENLAQHGFHRYEVSAFHRGNPSVHNLNYWEYGDYLGIGAGAHTKITDFNSANRPVVCSQNFSNFPNIIRQIRHRQPSAYLTAPHFVQSEEKVEENERIFEFMLNGLRLTQGVPRAYFSQRTGMSCTALDAPLKEALASGWLIETPTHWKLTPIGQNFLNDVVALFLRDS